MKKFFFLLLIIMPFIAFSQKAKIEFENTSYNFKTIGEKAGFATCEFIFKNTGNVPLILKDVKASCGCTTLEWGKKPIIPGQSGKIKVAFDPADRPGTFTKSITVFSNAENPVISLTIRGNVSSKMKDPYATYSHTIGNVKLTSSLLNFGSISHTQTIEKEIDIVNTDKKPATITIINPTTYITTEVRPTTLNKGEKGTIIVKYNAAQRQDWGFLTDEIKIQVNQTTQGVIKITSNICEDFSKYKVDNYAQAPIAVFSENGVDLGEIAANSIKSHDFFIQNNGKSDLYIRKAIPSDEHIIAIPAKRVIKPGKKTKVTVNLKTDEEIGKIAKQIIFTLNDPQNTVIIYKVTGNII